MQSMIIVKSKQIKFNNAHTRVYTVKLLNSKLFFMSINTDTHILCNRFRTVCIFLLLLSVHYQQITQFAFFLQSDGSIPIKSYKLELHIQERNTLST